MCTVAGPVFRVFALSEDRAFAERAGLLAQELPAGSFRVEVFSAPEQLRGREKDCGVLLIRCDRLAEAAAFWGDLRAHFPQAVLAAVLDEDELLRSLDLGLTDFDDFLLENDRFLVAAAGLVCQAAGLLSVQQKDLIHEQHRCFSRSLFFSRLIYDHGYNEPLERINQKFSLQMADGIFRTALIHADFSRDSSHFAILEILQDRVVRYAKRLFKDICFELMFEYRLMGYLIFFNYGRDMDALVRRRCELLLRLLQRTAEGTHALLSMSLSGRYESWKDWESAKAEAYSTIYLRLLADGQNHVLCQDEFPQLQGQDMAQSLLAVRKEIQSASRRLDYQKFDYGIHRLLSLHMRAKSCQNLPEELYDIIAAFFLCHSPVLDTQIDSADAGKQIRWTLQKENNIYRIIYLASTQIKPYFELALQLSEQVISKPVRFAIDYVHAHCSEPVTGQKISSLVNLTPGYFSSLFKKEIHKTFSAYVMECKIELAKELLLTSDLSVQEISQQSGFVDPRYFSKRFKACTGVTPTKYRKIKHNASSGS